MAGMRPILVGLIVVGVVVAASWLWLLSQPAHT
jgi:hypothetical protein